MSAVDGPIKPNIQDPSKKRKALDSQEARPAQKALSTSKSSLSAASSQLISHLEATGRLERPTYNYEFTPNDFDYLSESAGSLHTIITYGDMIPEEVLIRVIENNKSSLQEVYIGSCPEYSAGFFSKLATCRQLKILQAPRNTQLNSSMVASIASIQTLRKLDLEDCIQLRDGDLKCIAEGNLELQELKLKGCKNIKDQGIEFLAKGAKKLTVLDLSWCLITDRGLQALAKYAKTLISLDISSCKEVTDSGVRKLLQKLKLQVLSISGCANLTDDTIYEIADSGRWTIESLDLSYCEKITDIAIKALAEYCQKLNKLDIRFCQYLTGLSVIYLAQKLPTLKVLRIDKVWDDDLSTLGQKFPQLRELDITCLNSTADEFAAWRISEAVKAFCANTTSLQRLGIAGSALRKALGEEFFNTLKEKKIELV